MNLTQSAATTGAQVIPVLALAVSAMFVWLLRGPALLKSTRKGNLKRPKYETVIDSFAWVLGAFIFIGFALNAVEATLICFDVTQGSPVRADAVEFVRGVIRSGMGLLFILPALAVVLGPAVRLAHFLERKPRRSTEARRESPQ